MSTEKWLVTSFESHYITTQFETLNMFWFQVLLGESFTKNNTILERGQRRGPVAGVGIGIGMLGWTSRRVFGRNQSVDTDY